jgi:predicted DCC family thiol-disulfide oxidoreductase YuxK
MADLTVLFDGKCNLCRGSAESVKRCDKAQRIEFLDSHDSTTQARFPQVNREEAILWMQAVDSNGRVFSGSDAWARIGLLLPGWKYVAWILLVPGIRWIAGKFYAWIARNRYRWNRELCEDGTCSMHVGKKTGSDL